VVVVPVEPPKEVVPPKEPEPAPKATTKHKLRIGGASGFKVVFPDGRTFEMPVTLELAPGKYPVSIVPPPTPEYQAFAPFSCNLRVPDDLEPGETAVVAVSLGGTTPTCNNRIEH
jgi:hypothetical protein